MRERPQIITQDKRTQSRAIFHTIMITYYVQRKLEQKRISEMLKNPRYAIFYKGKEVRRYAFYRQAKAYCLKHNSKLFGEDVCEIIDLNTGECINKLFE